ncbi:hypothetical protein ARTHRO8AJ_370147 [Arthrobacter sp. 8AJ]|nr:hypothetical protein ARTHRO8AJ_370147 [Arthrobacter sp. 8AJ]
MVVKNSVYFTMYNLPEDMALNRTGVPALPRRWAGLQRWRTADGGTRPGAGAAVATKGAAGAVKGS